MVSQREDNDRPSASAARQHDDSHQHQHRSQTKETEAHSDHASRYQPTRRGRVDFSLLRICLIVTHWY